MHWLEPLVEIAGEGFGPAMVEDVESILDGSSVKAIGMIANHPFIARQQRLTFARAGKTRPLSLEDYAATGGWAGLMRARVPCLLLMLWLTSLHRVCADGRGRLPGGNQVADRSRSQGCDQIYRLQC